MFPHLRDSAFIVNLKRLVWLILFGSLAAIAFLIFYKPPLPDKTLVAPQISENQNPKSELPAGQRGKEINKKIGNFEYILKPTKIYEIQGIVASVFDSDNFLNNGRKQEPATLKDICIVWGENVENSSYQNMSFSGAEFNCAFTPKNGGENKFSGKFIANNHLIPENDTVAQRIKDADIGDQIKFKGMLTDYTVRINGVQKFGRNSTEFVETSKNAANNIIYVTDFEIIKKHWTEREVYMRYAKYTALGSGILVVLLFFLI